MGSTRLKRLRYEDFPIKLFYHLLSGPERKAHLLLGAEKWRKLLQKWEEDDDSLESTRLLEDQKKVALPLIKAQKMAIALRWCVSTKLDRKALFDESNIPYREDLSEQVAVLARYIEKLKSQHENNLIQLQATLEQQRTTGGGSDFTVDDAIATLNLAGFTINDPNTLTIGQYKAMNRTIQRKNGKRAS